MCCGDEDDRKGLENLLIFTHLWPNFVLSGDDLFKGLGLKCSHDKSIREIVT